LARRRWGGGAGAEGDEVVEGRQAGVGAAEDDDVWLGHGG